MGRFAPQSLDLDGKVILVTGGTGSFGRRFVETVLTGHAPRKLGFLLHTDGKCTLGLLTLTS